MKFGIEHILILAKNDLKALVDWYVTMFDWEIVIDGGPDVYMVKASNGNMIEFGNAAGARQDANDAAGFRHLAICVDDFDAAVEKVRAAGVNGLKDPVVTDTGLGIMFFEDPEGNLIHLVKRPVAL